MDKNLITKLLAENAELKKKLEFYRQDYRDLQEKFNEIWKTHPLYPCGCGYKEVHSWGGSSEEYVMCPGHKAKMNKN